MALLLGASFVARSFSGDKRRLVPLLKAAIRHHGAALPRCRQPLRRLQQPPGLDQSYDHVRAHNEAVNQLDVVPARERITADHEPGTIAEVLQHDGSVLRLRKLAPDYDPHDRIAAMTYLQARHAAGEIVTGMLYVAPDAPRPA